MYNTQLTFVIGHQRLNIIYYPKCLPGSYSNTCDSDLYNELHTNLSV